MPQILDARGLSCPAPVLLVKDAVENGPVEELEVLVDNQPSCENVTRFLGSRGYPGKEERQGTQVILRADRPDAAPRREDEAASFTAATRMADQKIAVLVASDQLGSGDPELGRKLMINYLKTLKEMGPELWHLIFVNSGIKLTVDDSPVLAEIAEYEQPGTIVLVCGTCLEHFHLTDRKKVGGTTNMLDIVTATQLADKVITMS